MEHSDKTKVPLPRTLHRLNDPITGQQCVYPIGIGQENLTAGLQVLANYQYQPHDTWVCSFAKSGTTWTEYIVWLIMHDGKDFPDGKSMGEAIPMIEFDACEIKDLPQPRIIKTHYEKKMLTMSEKVYKQLVIFLIFRCFVI